MEKKRETTIVYWGYIGLYGDLAIQSHVGSTHCSDTSHKQHLKEDFNPHVLRGTRPGATRIAKTFKYQAPALRVQVPNNHILAQNLYYNCYYPKAEYLIIGYMDP